jgi:tetratricopeptide (TPR) repeat protein
VPGDCPLWQSPGGLAAIGSRLVIYDGRLLVYDIAADTWYGPFSTFAGGHFVVASHGMVWSGLTCFAVDDVIAYAQRTGRVVTTAQYRRRLQQYIDGAAPLDRAKLLLATRQFDKAKAAFRQILAADPHHGEALILMGFLHDRDCLNQPDEAINYYRRAAELEDNPVASCSGMCFWARVLRDREQWQETLDLCKKILQRYPRWEGVDQQYLGLLTGVCQEELRRKNAKQPAPATSNKIERPAR